ncbi:hypothetical protein H114_05789 [Streptomyces gancidicus BKS 13-15]|uniref:CHAT domain-containing protein n=1 Tax=Streptomyces gancidicus BKS 13-15 TaxID=1284664 RepID=M3E8Q4_STREZ|nr:CHAT domain-containing protein [Streptomyces gancidicus]EMF30117.1 hypothetical protein H114_05789 [Streptomyces gancidicus BKS 13-15]
MAYDRDEYLRALQARLSRVGTADGPAGAEAVSGPGAVAELRGLLRTADPTTDMEARHAAGWLCLLRGTTAPPEHGPVYGAMAGALLFPVWVADPASVPPELAARYAITEPVARPDPAAAGGPAEWSALCVAAMIAAEGRQHTPPPDASGTLLRLHQEAARVAAWTPSRELQLAQAVGLGSLAVLATWEYDSSFAERLEEVFRAVSLAGTTWPFGDLMGGDPVRFIHRAVKQAPAASPARLLALDGLARRLKERYLKSSDVEDLREAVGIARDVVAQLPPGHPHLVHGLAALGRALLVSLQAEGATTEEDYDEVVDLCRRGFLFHPQGPAGAGHDLGTALALRAQYTGRVADLDDAAQVLEEALRAARHPGERAALHNALGSVLRFRSVRTGAEADLEAALALTDPATEGTTGDPQPAFLAGALALYTRYTRDPERNGADLDEALRRIQEGVASLPPGHLDRPGALTYLGLVLRASYERSGRAEDLHAAVDAHREAVALTTEGHGVLGLRLINLSAVLILRHHVTGDGEDLREAWECRRRAAALPGLGRTHRATLLSSMGSSRFTGYERAADPVRRLEQSVDLFRQALALTPEDDPQVLRRRLNLAIALLTLDAWTARTGTLREARELADAVLAALPANSPDLPGALMAAAGARMANPRTLLTSAARQEVVALHRRAVDATPPGHPRRASRLIALAGHLRELAFDRRRRRADLSEAADVFSEAALQQQCPPSERLDAALGWGLVRTELGEWDRALDGYEAAVDLLHSVAPRQLLRDDQEFLLSRVVGLGAAAAACAVRRGRPGLAVGLLEQGRGVILSHAFDADSDLTRLRETAPGLAARFEELRDALDTATVGEPLPEEGPPGRASRADQRQRLAEEWRNLTDRIRAEHPGLGLLRPVREWDERELRATAAAGPVVLVNVSPYGSDALIVTEHAIDAVPLPGLDPRTTERRRRAFENALVRIETPGISRRQSQRAQQVVRATLAWLWQEVTGPVLDRLPGATRVWWSPGGLLGTLPLHAATPADGGPGALDRVVSSYTPTLRALHHARLRAARPAGAGTLVVSVPEPAGQAPLPGARSEAGHLARLIPGATLLADASATHTAVATALHHHAYAHFACHALGDVQRPSGSRLVLHDHRERPLTVRDLARLRLPSVRLAYLSACATLRTSPELADEAVHIVSAFQMAGFPHVVGSLWHVDDAIGAEVALRVYEELNTGDGTLDVSRTAEALHRAVRTLRDTYPETPSLWACQVHAGP